MAAEKFKLSPEQQDFLHFFGNVTIINGEEWHFVPRYFKVDPRTGMAETHDLGKLPDYVVEHINDKRNRINDAIDKHFNHKNPRTYEK